MNLLCKNILVTSSISFENGSNLHGLLNDCIDKITMYNLPEIIHNFQNKTGYYGFSEEEIDKVKAVDSSLRNQEKKSVREMFIHK